MFESLGEEDEEKAIQYLDLINKAYADYDDKQPTGQIVKFEDFLSYLYQEGFDDKVIAFAERLNHSMAQSEEVNLMTDMKFANTLAKLM